MSVLSEKIERLVELFCETAKTSAVTLLDAPTLDSFSLLQKDYRARKAFEITVLSLPKNERVLGKPEVRAWIAQVEHYHAVKDPAKYSDSGGFKFTLGTELELSRAMARRLTPNHTTDIVYDRGDIHVWSQADRIWEMVSTAKLTTLAGTYEGAIYGDGSSRAVLKVSATRAQGAIKFMQAKYDQTADVDNPGFFDGAPRGVLLEDAFIEVDTKRKIIQDVTPAREHRQRTRVGLKLPSDSDLCPLFDQALSDIFDGDPDQEALENLLLEGWAAGLLGVGPAYEKAFIYLDATEGSDGSNGKSMLLKVLGSLLPSSMISSVPPQRFNERFDTAIFSTSRLNIVSEMPDGDILSSDALKSVITGDAMRAEIKYKDPFIIRPQATHFFAANQLPRVGPTEGAIFRRMVIIPFRNRFTPTGEPGTKKGIPDLHEMIVEQELMGVLRRILVAGVRLVKRGHYDIPESCRASVDAWAFESDPVAQFLDELTDKGAGQGVTPASVLYTRYAEWCPAAGYRPKNITNFGKSAKRLVDSYRTKTGMFYRVSLLDSF